MNSPFRFLVFSVPYWSMVCANRSRSSLDKNNREQLDKQHPAFVMRSLFTNLNTHILKSLYIIEIHYLYSIFPDIIFLKTHSCKPRYWKMPRETLMFLICIHGFICFFVHPAPFILFILIALGLVVDSDAPGPALLLQLYCCWVINIFLFLFVHFVFGCQ